MRGLPRRGAEGPWRSPAARGSAAALRRPPAFRHAVWLERRESRGVDEACRRPSVRRRHHRDFRVCRLDGSVMVVGRSETPPSASRPLSCSPSHAGRVGGGRVSLSLNPSSALLTAAYPLIASLPAATINFQPFGSCCNTEPAHRRMEIATPPSPHARRRTFQPTGGCAR